MSTKTINDLARARGITLPCENADPDDMFPEDETPIVDAQGNKIDNPDVAAAKAHCLRCDLRAECLQGALRRREPVGIWGATTTNERNAMLRKHYRQLERGDETLEVAV